MKKDGPAVSVAFRRWKVQNINTDGPLIQTSHSVVSQLGVFYLFIYLLSHDTRLTFYLDFLLFKFLSHSLATVPRDILQL